MNIQFLFILIMLLHFEANAQNNHNFKTHYQIFGSGKPILIINGGPGMNSNGFKEMANKIADLGYQTIIFDQRGTGNSKLNKLNTQTISMDLMVEDMEALRKQLKIKKWTILGHSFGGLLACHYFSKYSKNIDKLIFSSSAGVNMNFTTYINDRVKKNLTQMQRDSLDFYENKMQEGDTTFTTIKKRAGYLANAYVYNKEYTKNIANRLLELNFTVNNLVFQDLIKIKYNYTNQFIKKSTPVLIMQGNNQQTNI